MTVTGISAAAAATTTSTANTYADMDSNQFMQLLLTELKYQDPLEPMESNQIMQQITQLNSLQELQSINGGIENLAENDELVEAASLIDTIVSYVSADGLVETGLVSGITRENEQTRLMIGEDAVPLEEVLSIQSAAEEG